MRPLSAVVVVVVVVVAACSAPPPPLASVGDFCAEHRVLEALCTRHHPSLIAVFQAKGDWCAEHDYPESICPICHPERGGRPSVDVTADDDDGAPKDGMRVRLKGPEMVKAAGIVTVAAVARDTGASVGVIARVVYDAKNVAVVNARAAGVVRAVRVDVGARVGRGQALAVIDSAAVGAERGNLQAAHARLAAAEAAITREAMLVEQGVAAQKDLQLAQRERDVARAEVAVAEAALGVVGGSGEAGGYTLTAPLGGIVVERDIAVGQTVTSERVLFQIVDPSAMRAELEIPERDLAVVAVQQPATIDVDALPGRSFRGVVQYIAPHIDERTRTARARVALDNKDGALRANMFGRARVSVGAARAAVFVPKDAVQRARDVFVVFVKVDDVSFEARRVVTGVEDGDVVEVVKGVAAGEEVATVGSFFLKTETLKGAIGAGCCD